MSVTVIIPTTCEHTRGAVLCRAIGSVAGQLAGDGRVLVVANGPRVDEDVLQTVRAMPRVAVERLAEGSVARAQLCGRLAVRTPFFSFLDDDDEYLPGAIELRLAALQADSALDALVTNGYLRGGDADSRVVDDPMAATDPLRALLRTNWLASCAGLFRAATITPDYFDGQTRFFEWTLLAYRLAVTRHVRFVDVPTYRIHASARSASKSRPYREALPVVLRAIARLELPADVRRAVRRKIGRAEHDLAASCLREGEWAQAARHHVRSVLAPGGLRFVLYSRKLLHRGRRVRAVPR